MPNNLTISGAVYDTVGPKFGLAGLVGGVGAASITLPVTWTVECWFKTNDTSGAVHVLMGFDGGSWLGLIGGNLRSSTDGGSSPSVAVADSAYHHAAITHAAGVTTLFVDGVLVGGVSDPDVASTVFRIRDYGPAGGYAFSGVLDEVAIWSGRRYTAGFAVPTAPYVGNETGLLALYHLNGDGADSSGASSALATGALAAKGTAAGVTLSLSAELSGGSGAGYGYAVYRGTDPDFVVGSGTLLATPASLPYSDTTAAEGVSYYYGVVGHDGAGATINALPAGMSAIVATPSKLLYATAARLVAPALAIVFIGTSITAGAGLTNVGSITTETAPANACAALRRRTARRQVTASNQGVSGSLASQWLPGAGTGYYNAAKAAMTALLAAAPSATPVFSIELGINDSPNRTASQYVADMKVIVDQVRVDFPSCRIVLHRPTWFSPTTRNTVTYEQAALSNLATYTPALAALVATYSTGVYAGDQLGYQYFAETYLTTLQSENGTNGAFFIHPNTIGARDLGEMWATSIANALFGGVTTVIKRLFRSMIA